MLKSTHKCEIVPIKLEPHPDADSLSIVRAFGYTVCVRTEDWLSRELGAYVVPDSLVDTRRIEFAWLNPDCVKLKESKLLLERLLEKDESLTILADLHQVEFDELVKKQQAEINSLTNKIESNPYQRIKVKKLRGIISQGLLIPAPIGSKVGDDVAEQLGILRYEVPEPTGAGDEFENGPFNLTQKYDIDSLYRYANEIFVENEPVYVREKLDGSNSYYVWAEDRIWVASRGGFKKQDAKSIWWQALDKHPEIYDWCKLHPNYRLYGEVIGHVKGMLYGPRKHIAFRAFDIMNPFGHWLNPLEAESLGNTVPWAPVLDNNFSYNFEKLVELSNGPSLIEGANHLREGIIVEPIQVRFHHQIGRVKLKIVSNDYLSK